MNNVLFPYNAQHIGDRTHQQDYFAFSALFDREEREKIGSVAVLADGMGGLENGRQAAVTGVETFLGVYRTFGGGVEEAMEEAVHAAGRAVYALPGGGGTTLAAAVVMGNHLHWCSVGDSRIYLCQNGELRQLNSEHNYRTQLMKEYGMDADSAAAHPEGDALTAYLGQPVIRQIDGLGRPAELGAGDSVLLCSDGLYRALDEREMAGILAEAGDPAEELIRRALGKHLANQDNITALVMRMEE